MQQQFSVGDKHYYLEIVKPREVRPGCIFLDSSFLNTYKKGTSVLDKFERSNVDLRFCHKQITYHDLLKQDDKLQEALTILRNTVKRSAGCLITDHGPIWLKLASEFHEQGKLVYMTYAGNARTVYRLRQWT